MATLLFLDGFEHGRATSGVAGMYNTVAGSPSTVTTPVRTGLRAMEISAAGAAESVQYTIAAGSRVVTMAFYIRFASLPAADAMLAEWTSNANGRLYYDQSENKFMVSAAGSNDTPGGPTLATDTWYRIVTEYDASGASKVLRCQVDDTTGFSSTTVSAAADITIVRLGTSSTHTYTGYYDDWIVSVIDGDYEEIATWQSHEVESLIPTSDGTHSISGANEIERTATGTDITNSTTDAYELVNDRPLDVTPTDYINDVGTNAASYCEMLFENLTSSLTSVAGVRGYAVDNESTGTGASSAVSRVVTSGGTSISPDLRLSTDDPGTAVTVRKKILTASSPPWDVTQVNDLRVRCGLGNGAPDVFFASFMLEVALFEPEEVVAGAGFTSVIVVGV